MCLLKKIFGGWLILLPSSEELVESGTMGIEFFVLGRRSQAEPRGLAEGDRHFPTPYWMAYLLYYCLRLTAMVVAQRSGRQGEF